MNERVNQSAEFEAEIKEKYEKWIIALEKQIVDEAYDHKIEMAYTREKLEDFKERRMPGFNRTFVENKTSPAVY